MLLLHAVSQLCLKVDAEVDRLVTYFNEMRVLPDAYQDLSRLVSYDESGISACIQALVERDILTENSAEEDLAALRRRLSATHGRDPVQILDRFRRELKEGGGDYWAARTPQSIADLCTKKKRIDIILFGNCDLHMESDFLRREGVAHGCDLHVAATMPNDFAFALEHKHDAVIVGALRARHFLVDGPEVEQKPHTDYIAQARHSLEQLRAQTVAPIFIDNLPEPTVQPLGLAESGINGHRARFRRTNLALAELAESFSDVYVVDIAATLAAVGTERLVDDGQVGFTHMGSPGWMLQRPASEKDAVHHQMPDMSSLVQMMEGDPYRRESVVARAHMDAIVAVLGIGRKKCVIVDLDNTLWPGVLAENGTPFAWNPSTSSVFSYIGLFFGLHEALLCLKKRGIVLACVSKNDESVVRQLWHYPDNYPRSRLLTLDDFVTHRINWKDKTENICSIADELGFQLDALLFIDDHPVERDRVRRLLPEVEVWCDDLFSLRRLLLSDPRLQSARVTEESAARTTLTKAQLHRRSLQSSAADEDAYLATLQIRTLIEQITDETNFERVQELFLRTTQFNTTGRTFAIAELKRFLLDPNAHIFSIHVSDRFGDHGLVGAAVVEQNEIVGLVLSCRVLGMGVEDQFINHILAALGGKGCLSLKGRIIPTARNIPVRNIYRNHGFKLEEDNMWVYG